MQMHQKIMRVLWNVKQWPVWHTFSIMISDFIVCILPTGRYNFQICYTLWWEAVSHKWTKTTGFLMISNIKCMYWPTVFMVHKLCIIMLDTDATNEFKCTFLSEHQICLYFNPFLFSSFWLHGIQDVPHGITFRTVKRETNCITINQRGKWIWI